MSSCTRVDACSAAGAERIERGVSGKYFLFSYFVWAELIFCLRLACGGRRSAVGAILAHGFGPRHVSLITAFIRGQKTTRTEIKRTSVFSTLVENTTIYPREARSKLTNRPGPVAQKTHTAHILISHFAAANEQINPPKITRFNFIFPPNLCEWPPDRKSNGSSWAPDSSLSSLMMSQGTKHPPGTANRSLCRSATMRVASL